jgi:hypothetical protein
MIMTKDAFIVIITEKLSSPYHQKQKNLQAQPHAQHMPIIDF